MGIIRNLVIALGVTGSGVLLALPAFAADATPVTHPR